MTVIDTYLEHAAPDKRAAVEHIRALAPRNHTRS